MSKVGYSEEMELLKERVAHYQKIHKSYEKTEPDCEASVEALQLSKWLFELMQVKRDLAFDNLMEFMNDTSQIPRGDIHREMEYAGDDPDAFLRNAERIIEDKKKEVDLKAQFAEKAIEMFDEEFDEIPSVSLEVGGTGGDISGAWINCWKFIKLEDLIEE